MHHILTTAMGFCYTLNTSEISEKKLGKYQLLKHNTSKIF